MSRLDRSVLHLVRFTLEAKSALSIGTGGSDGVYDHPIVRDANGLPQIPGTSLAGVLRHLWITDQGSDAAATMFGYQRRDVGEASRLEVAACVLQDSLGQPAEGLLDPRSNRLRTDRLLSAALSTCDDPNFRDRVRLTHRGVAKQSGKFDRGLLLAGYRFSGELRLWSDRQDDPDWETLLSLLADPRLRLGGGTRAGLGAMTLKTLHRATFDLRKPADIERFGSLSPSLSEVRGLEFFKPVAATPSGVARLRIELKPNDFWRIGQGDAPLGDYRQQEKSPTLLPKSEQVVIWKEHGAGVRGDISTRRALVPGSSVKGALAHRTAFHWNTLSGQFVEDMSTQEFAVWDKSEDCEGVKALFGYAKDRETAEGRKRESTGQVGHILIDDVYLIDPPVASMIHNSIDRFTGGVRNRMLFTEELLHQIPIALSITLLPGALRDDPQVGQARRAFARALVDLCTGHLALGGGATKGHGTFTGTPDQATKDWLQAQGETV